MRIIVTGLIAQHYGLAGVAWDYVQYAAGLVRLGHDVYYFEDSGEWPYVTEANADGSYVAPDCIANVRHLAHVLSRFGLRDKWAYHYPVTSTWYGISDSLRREVVRSADLLINVSGTLQFPQNYREVPRLAYIDSDPVFTQIKVNQSDAFRRQVETHDVHFSFGETFSPTVPATSQSWRPARQPVLFDEWRNDLSHRGVYTTIMSWTSYEPLLYGGRRFGQKDVELVRFLDLPREAAPAALEIALSSTHHAGWELAPGLRRKPAELLAGSGWRIVDPDNACPDIETYRSYIQTSKGEWSVAKNGYVVGQAGWFSCRSACYLAAGRPVIVQNTGFPAVIPAGEGVIAFDNFEQAAAAIEEVERNYQKHARAAIEIAEEYFDSGKVLEALLEEAMANELEDLRSGA